MESADIATTCVVIAAVFVLVGIWFYVDERGLKSQAKEVVKNANEVVKKASEVTQSEGEGIAARSAQHSQTLNGMAEYVKGLGELAKGMAALGRPMQAFILAVVLIGFAAGIAVADNVVDAVK